MKKRLTYLFNRPILPIVLMGVLCSTSVASEARLFAHENFGQNEVTLHLNETGEGFIQP